MPKMKVLCPYQVRKNSITKIQVTTGYCYECILGLILRVLHGEPQILHAGVARLQCILNTFGILKRKPQIEGWILSVLHI